jgi:hypothetical protein
LLGELLIAELAFDTLFVDEDLDDFFESALVAAFVLLGADLARVYYLTMCDFVIYIYYT